MENALLIGLSRQIVLERHVDVIANNVANINTTGFKADRQLFEEFLAPAARDESFVGRDRRVSYVQDRGTIHDFAQGSIEPTKNPLDVALTGNAFLVVQTPNGERYTRNGALQVNSQGQLVTASGNPVLGTGGPITIQSGDQDINIAPDGNISVREGLVTNTASIRGKLRLVRFDQPQRLTKEGATLFAAPAGVAPQTDPLAQVRQGFIEKSNVNAVAEMSRMIEAMRAYQQISAIVQQQGDLRKTALDRISEVPV